MNVSLSITRKSTYGIEALLYLAGQHGSGLTQLNTISKRCKIPAPYLLQILNRLVRADLVNAVRGPQGGYKLARPPAEITLLQAIDVLEGHKVLNRSTHEDEVLKEIYENAQKAASAKLGLTLEEILDRRQQKNKQLMYYI